MRATGRRLFQSRSGVPLTLLPIVALAYGLYVERLMIVEEAFLADHFPAEFPRWASRTRAFLPRLSDWIPSTGPLQYKRVSSEHNGLLTIAVAFTASTAPRESHARSGC